MGHTALRVRVEHDAQAGLAVPLARNLCALLTLPGFLPCPAASLATSTRGVLPTRAFEARQLPWMGSDGYPRVASLPRPVCPVLSLPCPGSVFSIFPIGPHSEKTSVAREPNRTGTNELE